MYQLTSDQKVAITDRATKLAKKRLTESQIKQLKTLFGFTKSQQGGIVKKVGNKQIRIWKDSENNFISSRLTSELQTPIQKRSGKFDSFGVGKKYDSLEDLLKQESDFLEIKLNIK